MERHGTMRVYIVRHGKAEDTPSAGACGRAGVSVHACDPDFHRELTMRGTAQARFLGAKLKGADKNLRLILASDYKRADQTAKIIQREVGCLLQTEKTLAIGHDASEVLATLQRHGDEKSIMLVGHNPQLGELLSVLACGLPPQEMILKTGELVGLEIRLDQPVGSAKMVQRLRLEDHESDDTFAAAPVVERARTK